MTSHALTDSELDALRRTTVASLTVGVLVAAGLVVTFWLLLHPVQSDGCTTSLLASPFKTALVPAHLAAAAALSVCVWMLSASRRRRRLPAKPTVWFLSAAWVYELASVIDHELFGPAAMASVIAAPTVGLLGLLMLVLRTVVALRSPQLAPTRWQHHAFATQVLLWGAFLIGLPANLTYAWLSGANFFCF
jgi:hypothetical protein